MFKGIQTDFPLSISTLKISSTFSVSYVITFALHDGRTINSLEDADDKQS